MAAYDEREFDSVPHQVTLNDREKLSISGVVEVESFDENSIVMETAKGTLVVRGEGMHIEKLSLDGGGVSVEGSIDSLSYESDGESGGGLFRRWFR